jgi:hypothetical protein
MRAGRMALTVALAVYGLAMLRSPETFTLIDNINLPIHETGHLVFAPFSEQITALGGTLFQLIVPIAFAISFWLRGDRHAASVMLWWVGQNGLYIGSYMADAVVQELPLVGGGEHDWGFLFGEWNVLAYSERIGHDTRIAGGVVMLAATVLGVWTALQSADGHDGRERTRTSALNSRASGI